MPEPKAWDGFKLRILYSRTNILHSRVAHCKHEFWKVIHLWGTPGASSAQERSQGVHNVLDPLVADKTVEMVADLTAQFNKPQGMKVTEDILATTSDIHAVITGNDDMALGAMEAFKGAGVKVGFPDGVIIVGFDAIDPAVAAVERGEMYCTVAQ